MLELAKITFLMILLVSLARKDNKLKRWGMRMSGKILVFEAYDF